jgi:hypothetical protein
MVKIAGSISTALYIGAFLGEAQAFTATNNRVQLKSEATRLYNVPPPGTDADPLTIKKSSNREAPPSSFYQLQINSARAAELAIRDGYKLIEVEVSSLNEFYTGVIKALF